MNDNSPTRETGEFLAQLGDTLVSTATTIELLEKIPFASYIAKAFALKEAFHLQRLARNCKAFMDAAKEGDTSNLADRLRERAGDSKRLWELEDTTLQILIESEKPIKAEVVGRLLVALADGRITFEQFDTLSLLLVNGSVPALNALPTFFDISKGEAFVLANTIGDAEPLLISLGVASRLGSKFTVSELGRLLHEIGFLHRR